MSLGPTWISTVNFKPVWVNLVSTLAPKLNNNYTNYDNHKANDLKADELSLQP